jgi:phosphatidylserine/phosphatidylglycerophosphate/cardiolipin synthase-like enzyme
MGSFDITSILDFNPPNRICPACRGLIHDVKYQAPDDDPWGSGGQYSCPVCEVTFVGDIDDSDPWGASVDKHFRDNGWVIDHNELIPHATALAKVVRQSRGQGNTFFSTKQWPTMRTLFEVISRAKYFVHFTTWGISHQLIGALKMASMRVPVYGFASSIEAHARAELTDFPDETPNLQAKVIPSSDSIHDAPHQKIIVIDGLVAFKGSTNLTNAGARRADRGLDVSELVTDSIEVTKLNNRYFAPVWRKLHAPGDTYTLNAGPF